jgi:outer membrane protein
MRLLTCATAMAMAAISGLAHAADLPAPRGSMPVAPTMTKLPSWFIHLGPGGVFLAESAKMNAGGFPLTGATISVDPQLTPVLEVGYFITPNFAVSVTGGLPPKISIKGAGTVAGLGTLGTAVYGPATLTAHYHFTNFGRFQPYIGGGLAIMKVFSTSDRVLSNLKIEDTFGPALQIGADFMIDDNWGAFIDVKKAFLRTISTGSLGGVPVRAKTTLDPLVVHSGLTYRF